MSAVRKKEKRLGTQRQPRLFITNGTYADITVVNRRYGIKRRTRTGSRLFVVEKGTKGFSSRQKKKTSSDCGASDTSELIFEDCLIPEDALLGKRRRRFFVDAMRVLDGGRISIAALGLGHGARPRTEAAAQVFQSNASNFGKSDQRISKAIQWKLADMATEIDAARLLTMRRLPA